MDKATCPKCNAQEFVEVHGEFEGQPVSYFVCESCDYESLDGPA